MKCGLVFCDHILALGGTAAEQHLIALVPAIRDADLAASRHVPRRNKSMRGACWRQQKLELRCAATCRVVGKVVHWHQAREFAALPVDEAEAARGNHGARPVK